MQQCHSYECTETVHERRRDDTNNKQQKKQHEWWKINDTSANTSGRNTTVFSPRAGDLTLEVASVMKQVQYSLRRHKDLVHDLPTVSIVPNSSIPPLNFAALRAASDRHTKGRTQYLKCLTPLYRLARLKVASQYLVEYHRCEETNS